MLSTVEQDLVRRDSKLPGLEKLLNADAFHDALRAASGAKITSTRLRYLRYKPGQNCLAAYTLNVAGTEVECHAKAYRLGDVAKLDKANARPNITGPLGAGRFTWPRLGIEVCVFPNDNKLAALPLLADDARREDFLQRHLPERAGLAKSRIRTLAYKPERRWVGALEVGGVPAAVCKLYGESAFEEVRSKSKYFAQGATLRLAPLIGRSKGRRALLFDWQTGRLLSQAMLDPLFDPAVMFRVGVALAEFQGQPVPNLPVREPAAEAAALLKLGEFLEFLLPAQAGPIQQTSLRLASILGSMPAGNSVVHGDFYAKQVLFNDDTVTVLDLDEAARGDGMDDLGTFLGHLDREVVVGRITADQQTGFREQFLAGYRSVRGEIDMTRVDLRTAARLFGRLPHFFRNRDADWPQRTAETLARVQALLARHPAATQAHVMFDAKLPALNQALVPSLAGKLLSNLLRERDPAITKASLRRGFVRRHKPGRRALIQYELEVQRSGAAEILTLLGKMRRRGVDAENLAMVRELSESLFTAASLDEISIPEVFGAIPELGMTLQRHVPGQPAASRLAAPESVMAARRAAEAICKLHHCGVLPLRTHTSTDELSILQWHCTELAASKPAWSNRLNRLLRACRELAKSLPIVPPRPVHRDFYHDQLLFDGNRVWLLDLDLMCMGDPSLDAGNFAGHLIEWGVRSPSERATLDAARAAFTDRFLELSGEITDAAVEIYTTLTLARHVSISARFPNRAPFTEQILELCEGRCGLSSKSTRGRLLAASTP